jgi:hypothetical protein
MITGLTGQRGLCLAKEDNSGIEVVDLILRGYSKGNNLCFEILTRQWVHI